MNGGNKCGKPYREQLGTPEASPALGSGALFGLHLYCCDAECAKARLKYWSLAAAGNYDL